MWVRIDFGEWRRGVCNLGINPTFDGKRFQIEVHILDFERDIYGSDIEIQFIQRIRSERRFPSKQALKKQLEKDVEQSRIILK